ncbi:MAG: hypothetical protein JWP87_2999 [Labilithrix sp.]|nr:hypothetical protein [Labilithrix sp.]
MTRFWIRALVPALAALTTIGCELIVPSEDDLAGGKAALDAGAASVDATVPGAEGGSGSDSGADAGAGGPSLVQQTTGTSSASTSVVLTLPAPPRNGDALVVTIVAFAAATPTFTVSGGGVAWSQPTKSSVHVVTSVWAGLAASNGSASVTVTASAPQETLIAHLSEWSGLAAIGSAQKTEGSNAAVSGPLDVPDGTALVYASAAVHNEPFGAPTNGFVALTSVAAGKVQLLAAYRLSPPRGSYTTTWTEPAPMNNGWDAHIVSFSR